MTFAWRFGTFHRVGRFTTVFPRNLRPRRAALAGLVGGLGLFVSTATAADRTLFYQAPIHVPITAGIGTSALLLSVFESDLLPASCRWCDGTPGTVNAMDGWMRESLRWPNESLADHLSDISGYVLPAASVLVLMRMSSDAGFDRAFFQDVVVVAEAVSISIILHTTAKIAFGRERPTYHFASAERRSEMSAHGDRYTDSFYSGHAATAFSLAVAAGTIFQLKGSRHSGWVWGIGLTAAALTAYLRVAADRHYATDVLVGSLMGSAIGFAVPYFIHHPRYHRSAVSPIASMSRSSIRVGIGAEW